VARYRIKCRVKLLIFNRLNIISLAIQATEYARILIFFLKLSFKLNEEKAQYDWTKRCITTEITDVI
jgi:hypothetical protein